MQQYSCYIAGVPLREDGRAVLDTQGPATITLLEDHTNEQPDNRWIKVFVVEDIQAA